VHVVAGEHQDLEVRLHDDRAARAADLARWFGVEQFDVGQALGADRIEVNPEKDLDGSPRTYRFEATVTGADDQEVSAVTEVSRVVGREGRLTQRASVPNVAGGSLPGLAALGITPTPLEAVAPGYLADRFGPMAQDRFRARRR
jgi:hypothetical protein